MTDVSQQERYEKACACKGATASGPRLIVRSAPSNPSGYRYTQFMARMACDQCDTPWRKIEPANVVESIRGQVCQECGAACRCEFVDAGADLMQMSSQCCAHGEAECSAPTSVDAIALHEQSQTATEAAGDVLWQQAEEHGLLPKGTNATIAAESERIGRRLTTDEAAVIIEQRRSSSLSDAELEEIRERHRDHEGRAFVPGSMLLEMHRDRGRLLAHIAHLQHQLTALGPTLDEDELRRGTPDTPERIETIRRADAIHTHNKARALHRETEES